MRTDGHGSDTSGNSSIDFDPDIAQMVDSEMLAAKRGHIMREMIDTERMYVQEMRTTLEGNLL